MATKTMKSVSELRNVVKKLKNVYFREGVTNHADLAKFYPDMELPVIDESINFDTGGVSFEYIRLTTGELWAAASTKDDPDISMQISSVNAAIAKLFAQESKNDQTKVYNPADVATYDDKDTPAKGDDTLTPKASAAQFSVVGYKTGDVKVATGTFMFVTEDGLNCIILPNAQITGAFVAADGNTPAYWNCTVVPYTNSDQVDMYIGEKASA